MRIATIPQGVIEAVAWAAGLVPRPVFDTLLAAGLARTLMTASKLGVFEALADTPRTAAEVAARCGTVTRPTEQLLVALAGSGYVERVRDDRWQLAAVARSWLLRDAKRSLHDHMVLMQLVWRWLEHYETYLTTGVALDVHADLDERGWADYQRGMRSLAGLVLDEFVLRSPVPRRPTRLLDVGGAHGAYAAALCRKHPELHATVLDLPEATRHSAPLVAEQDLGARLQQRAGDARHAELGTAEYDVVLVSNLVHHFDVATNRALVRRLAAALKPGGVLIVQELMRGNGRDDQAGALASLYFATLSASATWNAEEIAAWQRDAGLAPLRPLRFASAPGLAQQSARKK